MRLRNALALGVVVAALAVSSQAIAQAQAQAPVPQPSTLSADGGFGISALANVTRLFFSGRYDVLSAGIGLGMSYKSKAAARFPFELGAYVAPQFSGDTNHADGRVSAIVQATFFRGFGIGAGIDAWRKGIGFGGGGLDDRMFITLGYGLTNEAPGVMP